MSHDPDNLFEESWYFTVIYHGSCTTVDCVRSAAPNVIATAADRFAERFTIETGNIVFRLPESTATLGEYLGGEQASNVIKSFDFDTPQQDPSAWIAARGAEHPEFVATHLELRGSVAAGGATGSGEERRQPIHLGVAVGPVRDPPGEVNDSDAYSYTLSWHPTDAERPVDSAVLTDLLYLVSSPHADLSFVEMAGDSDSSNIARTLEDTFREAYLSKTNGA